MTYIHPAHSRAQVRITVALMAMMAMMAIVAFVVLALMLKQGAEIQKYCEGMAHPHALAEVEEIDPKRANEIREFVAENC